MTARMIRWSCVCVMLLTWTTQAKSEEIIWRAARHNPPSRPAMRHSPSPWTSWKGQSSHQPPVALGRPIPLPRNSRAAERPVRWVRGAPARKSYQAQREIERRKSSVVFRRRRPSGWSSIVRAQGPPDVPPPTSGPVQVPPPDIPDIPYDPGLEIGKPLRQPFWERWGESLEFFGGGDCVSRTGRWSFQSDCDPAFLHFASPVTNPFYFEDPRALTEARPIFTYQSIPSSNPVFQGGHAEFFGVQGRLALTPRWSVVMNRLGFVSLNPDVTPPGFSSDTGFSEFNIGPKWTFWRSPEFGFVAALGVNVQVPAGSSSVFQDTGTVSLDPYLSFGKSFGQLPGGFGAFNVLGAIGYSVGDNSRSDFLHGSLHLDYDVGGLHRFFPLVEVNWFHYTGLGNSRDLGFEGSDLINFGSRTIDGRDYVTVAAGGRYVVNDWFQIGLAGEWAVTNARGINDFRATFDMIFRY